MNSSAGPTEVPSRFSVLVIAQWVLVVLLLGFAPIAMRFTPFKGIYSDGVWDADHTADPLYRYRAIMVGFGLVASAICTLCFIVILTFRRYSQHRSISLGLALAALATGWRMYPYWVTGVYSAMRGFSPNTDFDPKALIPMQWIGDLWRMPVLLMYLGSVVGISALLVAVVKGIRRRSWANVTAMLLCILITISCYIMSPNYLDWLMD